MTYSEKYQVTLYKLPKDTIDLVVYNVKIVFQDFQHVYEIWIHNNEYITELTWHTPNKEYLVHYGAGNLIVSKIIEFIELFDHKGFLPSQFEEFFTKRLPDQIYFIWHIHSTLELEGFNNES